MSCAPSLQPLARRLEFHQAMEQDYRYVDRELMEAPDRVGQSLYELIGRANLEGFVAQPTWEEAGLLMAVLERARELGDEYDMPIVPDESGSLAWCYKARMAVHEALGEAVDAASGCLPDRDEEG